MATTTEAAKPKAERKQDPIRAAASRVADAKRNRDRVRGRIARLQTDLKAAHDDLPKFERELTMAQEALAKVAAGEPVAP